MDFNKLRTPDCLSVLVPKCSNDLLLARIDDVRRVRPGEASIETEANPTMSAHTQLNVAFRCGWQVRRIEDEESLAFLVANPEFLFIRRESGAVRSMRDRRG